MKPSFQIEAQTGFWLTILPTQVKNRPTDPKDRASETFDLYFYLVKTQKLNDKKYCLDLKVYFHTLMMRKLMN